MKAYIASFEGEEWCCLVHGETRGKAKARFLRIDPASPNNWNPWVDIRLRRLPGMDDKPFTYEDCKAAGFEYTDMDLKTPLDESWFTNDCDCPICKGET